MHTARRLLFLFLAFNFVVLTLPVFGQRVIATLPVGQGPLSAAVNSGTNKIYVADWCGNSSSCTGGGTVTVIDGATDSTLSVNVGFFPSGAAVNPVTNRIYVVNQCGTNPSCANGSVSVIDGASNTVIASPTTGSRPYGVTVNSVTNRIYVPNKCGNDPSCHNMSGTVTVIDGTSNTVIATVPVGSAPLQAVVNSMTNQIYVANSCGSDPSCTFPYTTNGTVTVIDGVTNNTQSVNVGIFPSAVDINPVTNKIYVANQCGDDPGCGSSTVTAIDGATLATTDVTIGGRDATAIAVNSVINKIYVPANCYNNPSCQNEPNGTVSVVDGATLAYTSVGAGIFPYSLAVNPVANRIYVVNKCGSDPTCNSTGSVTVVDGATLTFTNISVGNHPYGLALNSTTNLIYVPNYDDETVSVMDGTPVIAQQFVPLSQPCRAVDTRPSQGGMGPIQGGTSQNFAISGEGGCAALPSAAVYSMNVTVVPSTGTLGYLTVWPAGQPRPVASTLNSVDGRIKANAAIVPAGTGGNISVYATDTTNVIVDVNGYFAPVTGSTLAFYPLSPCRVADTRYSNYPQGLGPPSLTGGQERQFPILNATTCNIPTSAAAYSLNFTVVPHGTLGFLTVWPTGQTRPTVSTLNDVLGRVIANAAIVVAGTSGEVSAYPTDNTDLVIDINGYFAPAGTGGLSLYGVTPCRTFDTRHIGSGQPFTGTLNPPVDVVNSQCGIPSSAQGYVFNATVIPVASLGYLTLWPDGTNQPVVSTLNATDGSITNNMALVPAGNQGKIDAYANGLTQLILDISSYFAP